MKRWFALCAVAGLSVFGLSGCLTLDSLPFAGGGGGGSRAALQGEALVVLEVTSPRTPFYTSAPGKNDLPFVYLNAGDNVKLIKEKGDYAKVLISTGMTGYVPLSGLSSPGGGAAPSGGGYPEARTPSPGDSPGATPEWEQELLNSPAPPAEPYVHPMEGGGFDPNRELAPLPVDGTPHRSRPEVQAPEPDGSGPTFPNQP